MKLQRGGTILGFIMGVVTGLALALVVAVYVTKVPVPFVAKGPSRTADQDAAEAKKNKDWDPNAPLYGKNPARPMAAASGPVSVASSPPVAAAPAKPASAPVPPASVKLPKPASADPLGDLAKTKAGVTGVEPFVYFVQVGAFHSAQDAEGQRAKLSLVGIETKLSEREQSGRTVYRVRVGPFDLKEEAERAKEKLDAAGQETALVRAQR